MSLYLLVVASCAPPHEAELVEQLRRQDPKALATFYDAYSTVIYRFALKLVKDPHIAEDVVQDTFHRLWTRSNQIREGVSTIGPWLYTIARNIAIDYLRSPRSHNFRRNVGIDEANLCMSEGGAEEALLSDESRRLIQKAFAELNDRERQMIELAYYEGLSQSEIAEKLTVPLGTVKTWTRAALQTLRRSMEKLRAA